MRGLGCYKNSVGEKNSRTVGIGQGAGMRNRVGARFGLGVGGSDLVSVAQRGS